MPLVNPDGFNVSREAQHSGARAAFDVFDYEMKRKNCRPSPDPAYASGSCADNPAGGWSGVDPNRNYGGLWGGGGASTIWYDATFRGSGPFSEPETQNIHQLVASREVTSLDHQPHVLEPRPASAGRSPPWASRSTSRT